MSDLISRQAVYDALMAEPLKWDDSSVWESARCYQWMMDMGAIKALPPAQPEMVKCNKCRYVYYDKEFDNYWCNRMSDSFKVEADGYCKWGK